MGEAAASAAIEEEFARLRRAHPNDFVVIGCSSHGSETHELLSYDAEIAVPAATCVPLDVVTEWFNAIPARHNPILAEEAVSVNG